MTADSLFPLKIDPDQIPQIPGLSYLDNYVTEAAEQELVRQIDNESWDTTWERRRQIYGGGYGSATEVRKVIPGWGQELVQRMWQEKLSDRPFDHLLVNEYLPGQGIALHSDYDPYDRTVVSLSLLSPCVMDFRCPTTNTKTCLLLEPRSLLVLSDAARYEWQHGIARRKSDQWNGIRFRRKRRISVTLRLHKIVKR
jgi:alkylated DNA repair dioxygenase AlkB